MTHLLQKSARAAQWSALDVLFRQGLQFAVSVVLARILLPTDFGIVALLSVFVAVASVFVDSGLGSALIQRRETTLADESTVFFFNLGIAVTTASLLAAAAPAIAAFFGQPVLVPLTYAMALNLCINAFGTIHTTLLSKALNFRIIAQAGGISAAVAGVIAVTMAVQGYGVWSLAMHTIVAALVNVVLLWKWHPWRPARTFRTASLRALLGFGGYEMAASLTDVFSNHLNLILIGKLYSVGSVGLFDRAQRTQQLPTFLMMGVANRVAYSVFSAVSAEKTRLVNGLRKSQAVSMFVNVPILLGMILLSDPLVATLYGQQWIACAPILQVLGIGALLWPLHVLNLSALKAQGRTDLFFRITLLKKTVTISLICLASLRGIMAMAWAQVLISLFAYFVNTHYTRVILGYGAWQQLKDLSRIFIAAIPMAVTVYLANAMLPLPPAQKLGLAVLLGAAVHLAACRLLCRQLLHECIVLTGLWERQLRADGTGHP